VRTEDNTASPDVYRPHAAAGTYVPTVVPAVPQWSARKPWHMASAGQFRPAAPPALTSEEWARDFNEVKAFGGKTSSRRSVEQTEIARFWEYSLPPIYYGVVRSVADMPGRDVASNARLFATVAQAMDDALIGIFDAKYHYNFWRPVTAIRNGDIDGNDATQRDAAWSPLIDTPMHPEFPSGHSILAASVARCSRRRSAPGPRHADDDQPDGEGRGTELDEPRCVRAGGVGCARLRRHPLPLRDRSRRGDGQEDRRACRDPPAQGRGAQLDRRRVSLRGVAS
jgi:hypothetical protein